MAVVTLTACGAKMPDAVVGTWRYFHNGRLTNEMTFGQDGPTSGSYRMEIFKNGYSEVHEGSWIFDEKESSFRLENEDGFTINKIRVKKDVLTISNTNDPDSIIEMKRAWEDK